MSLDVVCVVLVTYYVSPNGVLLVACPVSPLDVVSVVLVTYYVSPNSVSVLLGIYTGCSLPITGYYLLLTHWQLLVTTHQLPITCYLLLNA